MRRIVGAVIILALLITIVGCSLKPGHFEGDPWGTRSIREPKEEKTEPKEPEQEEPMSATDTLAD